jgi:membrane protein
MAGKLSGSRLTFEYVPRWDETPTERCSSAVSFVSDQPVDRTVTLVRDVVTVYRDRDISFLAGSIAYAAFVSLIPLVLLVLILASVLGGDSLRTYVITATEQYLTPAATGIIERSLSASSNRVGFSIFGGVALLWSVLKVFRTLDKAFNDLYEPQTDPGFLEQLRDGIIVLCAMIVAVLTTVGIGAVFAYASVLSILDGRTLLLRALGIVVLLAGLTVAFLPIYYVFPNTEMELREVLPGTAVAAVGWTLLQILFQFYVSMTSAGELYGVIGGVILLLTWLYFGAIVILLGGATNVVLFEGEPTQRTRDDVSGTAKQK